MLFFIGPRGSGKSTVGQACARRLGLSFYDTDALTVRQAGLSITEIVRQEGWSGFRIRESAALRTLFDEKASGDGVVATGGGLPLSAANRAFLRSHGLVLYLSAPLETLRARLQAAPEPELRPSLSGADPLQELEKILAERHPTYLACAHETLNAALPLKILAEQAARLYTVHAFSLRPLKD